MPRNKSIPRTGSRLLAGLLALGALALGGSALAGAASSGSAQSSGTSSVSSTGGMRSSADEVGHFWLAPKARPWHEKQLRRNRTR